MKKNHLSIEAVSSLSLNVPSLYMTLDGAGDTDADGVGDTVPDGDG